MTTPTAVAKKLALAGMVTLGAELAAAVLWPAPHQAEYDPSGLVGVGDISPLRVSVVGDSSCTAPGVAGPDEIWIRVLAGRIAAALEGPVAIRSEAVGGATAADVVASQLEAAIAFGPHLALVSVGANDVIRGVPMSRFRANLDTIVGRLAATGALVVTSGVGDLGTIPRLAPPLRQMARQLGRRADRVHAQVAHSHGAAKADQWDWAAQQFRTRRDIWSVDRFHPNGAGHQIWAETAWRTIEPLTPELKRISQQMPV